MKKVSIKITVLLLVISSMTQLLFAQEMRVGPLLYDNVYPVQNFGDEYPRFLQEAQTYYQLFDHEQTLFALNNAVLHNPNSVAALLKRAQFKELIGQKWEAAQDLRKASQLNPYAINLFGMNGRNGLRSVIAYQPELAVRELNMADRMNYYYDRLYYLICEESIEEMELDILEEVIDDIEEDRLSEALTALDALFSLFPESAIGFDLQGLVFTKMDRPEEAVEAFSNSVSLEPDFALAWYNYSQLERKRGNYEIAGDYLDRAIQLETDLTKAYFDRALLRKQLGDEEGAISDYERILKVKKDNYQEVLLNRGLTRKMLGDFDGALADLNLAVKEYNDDPQLYKNRGNLYLIFNYHQQAIDDYSKAVELDPNLAEAYYNRGLTYLILQNKERGCDDLSQSAVLGYERAEEKQKYFCGDL